MPFAHGLWLWEQQEAGLPQTLKHREGAHVANEILCLRLLAVPRVVPWCTVRVVNAVRDTVSMHRGPHALLLSLHYCGLQTCCTCCHLHDLLTC